MHSIHKKLEVEDLKPGNHACFLFQTQEEQRAFSALFLRRGLELNQKILLIVDKLSTDEALNNVHEDGVKFRSFLETGQLVVLARDEVDRTPGTFDPDPMIALLTEETERALHEGYSALRVTGEMSWKLEGLPGSERLRGYEARLNNFLPGSKCLAVCQYDRRRFDSNTILDILTNHPVVVDARGEAFENMYFMPPELFLELDPQAARVDNWMQNIVHRKRTEKALRVSENDYRALIDNLPGFVFKGFKDWSVEFYDNRVYPLTGYSMEEFNSRQVKWIHLLDKEDVEHLKETLVQSLRQGKSYIRDYKIRTKAGGIVWVQERGQVVCDEDGNIEYVSGVFFDVTDLKVAEKELKQSRALLNSTIESLPFDFFALGLDGRYILQNSEGKRRWGDIVGKRPEDLTVKSETLSTWLNANRRALSGETIRGELEYTRKGKREILYSIVAPIVSEGEILGVLGANIDITDRKLAEESIRKSEKRYRDLYMGLRNGFASVDMDGRISEFNLAFEQMLGYTREEIYKLTYNDITPEKWHAAESKIINEQVLTRGYSDAYEKEYVRKDGTVLPVELVTYLVQDEEGEPQGMWATVKDITEEKAVKSKIRESEERYRNLYRESRERQQLYESLLNSTPDAVVILSPDSEVMYVNPAFSKIFGFSLDEISGEPIPYVPDSEVERTGTIIENVLMGEPVSGFETRRMTKDGRTLDVDMSASCYRDHDGDPVGIVMILRDVTETKQTEKQLLHAQRMEAVGRLAGGIAHDFNNLLQAIHGYTELLLLRSEKGSPGYREHQEVLRAAKRGSELTRQLLTFSRKVETKKLHLDLNQEVMQAKKLLERTIPKMIDIELDLAGKLRTVNADATQIEQIIMNLAINAKDAMPEGGKLVIRTENATLDEEYCRTHLGAKPGEYVLLNVSDTGYGMNEETLLHIFEPFFSTKGPGEGTGLGLAMVYGIVKSHDGYIQCTSEPGKGASFSIYLPAIKRRWETEQEMELFPTVKGGTEAILFVDDEESVRNLAKHLIGGFGYKVVTAADGVEALDLYERRGGFFDLVILDVVMPGISGLACLEKIIDINPGAKVIVVSGLIPDGAARDALLKGAKGFVNKPFEARDLLNRIRDILDAR